MALSILKVKNKAPAITWSVSSWKHFHRTVQSNHVVAGFNLRGGRVFFFNKQNLLSLAKGICWWSLINVKLVTEYLWHTQYQIFSYRFDVGISRTVGSLSKYIRKKPAWQIQKNLKNICYSCYESSEDGKGHTFLVSFIIPLSWPEWFRSCFAMSCKIFPKITHQTAVREARPIMTPFFSKGNS